MKSMSSAESSIQGFFIHALCNQYCMSRCFGVVSSYFVLTFPRFFSLDGISNVCTPTCSLQGNIKSDMACMYVNVHYINYIYIYIYAHTFVFIYIYI